MRVRLTVLVVAMMLAAACGGATGDETESGGDDGGGSPTTVAPPGDDADQGSDDDSDQGEERAESPAAPAAPPVGSEATYTVDGESFDGDLYNCDPSDGAGDAGPGDLELVVLSGSSAGLSIDVSYVERRNVQDGTPFQLRTVSVRLNRTTDVLEEYSFNFSNDADGNWTTSVDGEIVTLDGPPVTVDGDRIAGEATLLQDFPPNATGTVAVSFNLKIPELSC